MIEGRAMSMAPQAAGANEAVRADSARAVRFMQIEPTTRCNFTCKFCCGRAMDQTNLDFDTFVRAVEAFPELEHIEIQGEGEPLAHPQFFAMVRFARSHGIKVSTISNGSLFTDARIREVLDSDLQAILVSIESPDAPDFAAIRGGVLATVTDGIRALLAARDARGRRYPSVGFAVTVLRRTQRDLPRIAALYRELSLDGGITVHMLNPMDSYRQTYDDSMLTETLSKAEEALVWAKYAKVLRAPDYQRSDVEHFYDNIYGTFLSASSYAPDHRAFTNVYRSCPWLDHALFVNRHGVATGCPRIKDYERFPLGDIRTDAPADIVVARNRMRGDLAAGIVAEPCRHCFIAESIAQRLDDVARRTPHRAAASDDASSGRPIVREGIGFFDSGQPLMDDIIALADGQRSGAEISTQIGRAAGESADEARRRVLPALDELVRRGVLVC